MNFQNNLLVFRKHDLVNEKILEKEKGRKLVTKKSLSAKEIIRKHSKDFGGSLSDAECMKLAGVSRNTFYKYKAEINTEMNI